MSALVTSACTADDTSDATPDVAVAVDVSGEVSGDASADASAADADDTGSADDTADTLAEGDDAADAGDDVESPDDADGSDAPSDDTVAPDDVEVPDSDGADSDDTESVDEVLAPDDADTPDDSTPPEDVGPPFEGPTGEWVTKASFGQARDGMAAASANGFLYVVGGFSAAGQPASDLYAYTISGNVWSTGKPMPTARAYAASGLVTGRIYVAGGADGTSVDYQLTERFNVGAESWAGPALPGTPVPICCGASASDGSTLYVAGGRDGAATLRSYAPAEGIWRDHAPMAKGRSFGIAAFLNGQLVAGLGAASMAPDAPPLASMEMWSPDADAWQPLPEAPAGRVGAAAVAWGGRLFVAGGLDESMTPSNSVWLFDIALGWTTAPSLPIGRAFHSLLASAEGLWCLGGKGPAAHLTDLLHLALPPLEP